VDTIITVNWEACNSDFTQTNIRTIKSQWNMFERCVARIGEIRNI